MSRLKVTLGGVEILGAPFWGAGVRGLYFEKGGMSGIDDGVSVRRESVAIPGQHGEFDLPVRRGARAVSLAGYAIADSAFSLGNEKRRLMSVGASGGLVKIDVQHQDDIFWMRGRLAAPPRFKDRGYAGSQFVADFEVQFVCSDPRKYGQMRRTGAGEAAVNFGSFPATPVLYAKRLSGSGGYTINAGSGQVQVTAALAVGATHRIDLRTGGVYSGSTRLSGAMGTFRPWTVPAGGTLTHTASAGIELTVETTDTHI